ncbi:MAG: hypothetical protein Q9227_002764 [Pyrenula ochraceoflavens]
MHVQAVAESWLKELKKFYMEESKKSNSAEPRESLDEQLSGLQISDDTDNTALLSKPGTQPRRSSLCRLTTPESYRKLFILPQDRHQSSSEENPLPVPLPPTFALHITPTGFRPYRTPFNPFSLPQAFCTSLLLEPIPHNVTKVLRKCLKGKELDCGYVYAFTRPSSPGFIKIGYTAGPVRARMERFSTTCGYEPDNVWSTGLVGNAYRIEKVVHEVLRDWRREEIFCKDNAQCHVKHREWFEMPFEDAVTVIEKWAEAVANSGIYMDGQVQPEFALRTYCAATGCKDCKCPDRVSSPLCLSDLSRWRELCAQASGDRDPIVDDLSATSIERSPSLYTTSPSTSKSTVKIQPILLTPPKVRSGKRRKSSPGPSQHRIDQYLQPVNTTPEPNNNSRRASDSRLRPRTPLSQPPSSSSSSSSSSPSFSSSYSSSSSSSPSPELPETPTPRSRTRRQTKTKAPIYTPHLPVSESTPNINTAHSPPFISHHQTNQPPPPATGNSSTTTSASPSSPQQPPPSLLTTNIHLTEKDDDDPQLRQRHSSTATTTPTSNPPIHPISPSLSLFSFFLFLTFTALLAELTSRTLFA